MSLFRINTVARNNNIVILQGTRYNNSRFTVYIQRDIRDIINFNQLPSYLYTNGTYYVINIVNSDDINNLNNVHNYIWDNVNYDNIDFPYYMYGIHDNAYYYVKGLILT